jgi:uncharacterized protein RhaS with RHS repeats
MMSLIAETLAARTHYNYLREYDPQVGGYVDSDPIGLKGGSYSTYGYAGARPALVTDLLSAAPGRQAFRTCALSLCSRLCRLGRERDVASKIAGQIESLEERHKRLKTKQRRPRRASGRLRAGRPGARTRGGRSRRARFAIDHVLWHRLWRWAQRRHQNKGSDWVLHRYWHPIDGRSWRFAADTGARTLKGRPEWLKLACAN